MLYWRIVLFRSPTVKDKIKVKMDGDKSNAVMDTVQPFPFRVGQPFNVSIVLLSADHTYSVIFPCLAVVFNSRFVFETGH